MFFVYLIIFGLVSSTSAYREKRQTENLEYVLNLLKQRGLLGQVDPELLTKAQNVIQSSKQDEFENDEDYDEEEEKETLRRGLIDRRELFSNSRERTFRSGLIDRRSQFRSKDDIQDNRRSIYESRNDLFRNSLRMDSVECDALKSENDLLKKRLETAERRGTNSIEDNSQLSALKVLQQQIQGSESQISHVLTPSPENSLGSENPLNLLKVEGGLKVRNSGEDYEKLQLSSSLVPLEPTISTFFETTSFESTILETKTTELPIHFHGRVIVRSIYDTESRVETVTSIITKSTEITPTPTWTTFTITPTQSIVPTPTAQKTQISSKKSSLEDDFQSILQVPFMGIRAKVIEVPETLDKFIPLQEVLLKLKEQKKAESQSTTDVGPTTSIMTVFLSGSKPGEFTTSLRTVTLTPERQKREINPSQPTHLPQIPITQMGILEDVDNDQIDSELDLQGSILNSDCLNRVTVTVTVTESVTVAI